MKNLKLIMCLLISFLLIGETIGQQFQVSQGTSATEMANALAGDGVEISNAETRGGNGLQKGLFFNGADLIGIENGVILTTGQASYATNMDNIHMGGQRLLPNELENTLITEDPDLEQLQGNLKGVSIFEFDVVISKSLLEFEFVFASDEYPDYVGSSFNDVFGFFISGPGIEGEFSNGAKNIAVVPGTNDFISVNTLNHLENEQLFNWGGGSLNNNGTDITYRGFTDVLKVSCPVTCGETYHIKMAISNVNDKNFDSAVFLKEGSLFSEFTIDYLFTDAQPICEGQLFNMTVEGGENGWTYEWSDGQITSIPNASTIASLDINSYSVTVTDENGCSLTSEVSVSVHASDNEPPFTSGIDGIPFLPNSGEFSASVHAGETLCFDIPTFDDSGEIVKIIAINLPSGAIFSDDDAFQETGTFCWTPTADDFGIYYFDVLLEDGNVCGVEQSIYTFEVKVLCPYCPKEIFYENRQPLPNGVPLPPHTIAGDRITAGESVDPNQVDGIVDTGEDQVIFQAPEIITIEPGFIAGPGFQAIIDPAACTYDCAACCDDFEGFTYDQIPNQFTPGGEFFEFWYVPDDAHPFCAFNAQGFRLTIFNRWGTPVYSLNEEYSTSTCCPFQAPAPENSLEHSSIYWDGLNINGAPSNNGVYFYVVTLFSCGQNESFSGAVALFDPPSSIAANDDPNGIVTQNTFINMDTVDEETIELAQREIEKFTEPLVYPNPFTDIIFVSLVSEKSVIEIYSSEGKLVTSMQSNSYTENIDVSNLASGTYVLKIVSEGNSHEQLIIKE